MGQKLYCGNLSYEVSSSDLEKKTHAPSGDMSTSAMRIMFRASSTVMGRRAESWAKRLAAMNRLETKTVSIRIVHHTVACKLLVNALGDGFRQQGFGRSRQYRRHFLLPRSVRPVRAGGHEGAVGDHGCQRQPQECDIRFSFVRQLHASQAVLITQSVSRSVLCYRPVASPDAGAAYQRRSTWSVMPDAGFSGSHASSIEDTAVSENFLLSLCRNTAQAEDAPVAAT